MNWYLKVWKQYADFRGRARRKEFWMFTLFHLIILIVFFVLFLAMGAGVAVAEQNETLSAIFSAIFPVGYLLFIGYSLAILVPWWAVNVRRLHDTGKSGVNFLIIFVPFVGGIIWLIWLCTDSQPGSNQWGPNPKEDELSEPRVRLDTISLKNNLIMYPKELMTNVYWGFYGGKYESLTKFVQAVTEYHHELGKEWNPDETVLACTKVTVQYSWWDGEEEEEMAENFDLIADSYSGFSAVFFCTKYIIKS